MGLTTPQRPAASASGSALLVLLYSYVAVKDIIQSALAPPSHNSLFFQRSQSGEAQAVKCTEEA